MWVCQNTESSMRMLLPDSGIWLWGVLTNAPQAVESLYILRYGLLRANGCLRFSLPAEHSSTGVQSHADRHTGFGLAMSELLRRDRLCALLQALTKVSCSLKLQGSFCLGRPQGPQFLCLSAAQQARTAALARR